jgi:hypothetical protein
MPRVIDPTRGEDVGRVLVGVTDVDDGPTGEQIAVIQALLTGYFGAEVDAAALAPSGPDETAELFPDARHRRRLKELLVLVEFCRHPLVEAQVTRVEEYATALQESGPGLVLARDLVEQGRATAMADYYRFLEEHPFEMIEPTLKEKYSATLTEPDPELAARLRALADYGEGTLGRAYVDFYERNGLRLPGDDPASPGLFVAHDMSHVIAGYEPTGPDEIGLGAMQLGVADTDVHWTQFLGNLSVHEAGFLGSQDGTLVPKEGTLDRPGAADTLAEAFSRGVQCTGDFTMVDHLAIADRQLDDVREEFGIPPRTR